MAWVGGILTCLAVGGCVAGVVLGTASRVKSDQASVVSQNISKDLTEKKRQFFEKLSIYSTCVPTYLSDSGEERFGTIYACPDNLLFYLKEESAFDWTKSLDDLMSSLKDLFKKVEKFNYKKDEVSKPYLLIDLEDETGKKKVFVNPSDSEGDWKSFKGFTPSLEI